MGLGCAVCARPLTADIIKEYAVPNTMSQAWYIGRAVHIARRKKTNYIDAIVSHRHSLERSIREGLLTIIQFASTPGKLLFTGKIIDVRRDINRGYTMGSVLLAPLNDNEREASSSNEQTSPQQKHMIVPFQNEYLYARYTDAAGEEEGEVVCTVPDLISILGQDGEAIGSQDLRYGLRVSVIAIAAHPLWKTEKGLKVGGPEGFGLDMPFTGVGEYNDPRSVIEDYGQASV